MLNWIQIIFVLLNNLRRWVDNRYHFRKTTSLQYLICARYLKLKYINVQVDHGMWNIYLGAIMSSYMVASGIFNLPFLVPWTNHLPLYVRGPCGTPVVNTRWASILAQWTFLFYIVVSYSYVLIIYKHWQNYLIAIHDWYYFDGSNSSLVQTTILYSHIFHGYGHDSF